MHLTWPLPERKGVVCVTCNQVIDSVDWTLVSEEDGVRLESHAFDEVCPSFLCFRFPFILLCTDKSRSSGIINAAPEKCAAWFWDMKMKVHFS